MPAAVNAFGYIPPNSPMGFPDFTEVDQGAPPPHPRKTNTRRDTIYSLVELLLNSDPPNGRESPQQAFNDEKDENAIDDQEVDGAEIFFKFQKRVNALDKELRNFQSSSRQLGSSAAILHSAYNLRSRLAHILHLYQENAADLFPRKIKPAPVPVVDPEVKHLSRIRTKVAKLRANTHFSRPTIVKTLDLEDFPQQFELFARDINQFGNVLNEFPEFTDDSVNASIHAFESDLKYWASCLQEYTGQFRYPAVQRYLHDLTLELGDHLENMTATLVMFIEVGVPTIRFAQKHGATNLLNLSTVATFFSAVTGHTMQFSFELNDGGTAVAVNSFWFASLVFSIGAAVNSLLGLTWKQAMYRSPGHKVPWWVLIWIKRSPLVLLVMSVACFSIGLCCFAYASNQSKVTSTITTVLTAFTSFGLGAVSLWFMSERWTYLRHQGKKWLSDVLHEGKDRFFTVPGFRHIKDSFHWMQRRLGKLQKTAHWISLKTASLLSLPVSHSTIDEKDGDLEANTLPLTMADIPRYSRPSDATLSPSGSPELPNTSPARDLGSPTLSSPNEISYGKQLWKNAIRTVRMRSAVSSNLAALSLASKHARNPHRHPTISTTLLSGSKEEPFIKKSRVKGLIPKLEEIQHSQEIPAHQALVRHLQFSPNGKYLATSSWDRTSVIFKVVANDPFVSSHRILAHTKGRVGQVVWSPNGKLLLTKLLRGIKVWTEDGVCKKTIDRPADVESLVWLPEGTAFMSVEGCDVVKMNINGNVLDTYSFGKIKLHDVAITPDGLRIVGVGPLLESPDGLKPNKCRAEKRLIVFNTDTKLIENQTPIVNDIRDVTLSTSPKTGTVALISYESKAPPQLWRMDMVKDRETNQTNARMTLRRTYQPKGVVDFAGPSYFGGKNDELIVCAGKAGDIHIWDKETGELLHQFHSAASGGDLTCIAWNSAVDDPFMFATGSHNGVLRIWTKPRLDTLSLASGRSASPMMDFGERTDSPVAQHEFESALSSRVNTPIPPSSDDEPVRERIVAFASDDPSRLSAASARRERPSLRPLGLD